MRSQTIFSAKLGRFEFSDSLYNSYIFKLQIDFSIYFDFLHKSWSNSTKTLSFILKTYRYMFFRAGIQKCNQKIARTNVHRDKCNLVPKVRKITISSDFGAIEQSEKILIFRK